jgi:hypothetical protein
MVHAQAGLEVDLEAVRDLLQVCCFKPELQLQSPQVYLLQR